MNKYEAAQGTLSLLNVLVLNDSDLSDKSIENIDSISLDLLKRGIILDKSFYYIEDYRLFKSLVDDFKEFDKIKLASIFNRFKPIFFKFKECSRY